MRPPSASPACKARRFLMIAHACWKVNSQYFPTGTRGVWPCYAKGLQGT